MIAWSIQTALQSGLFDSVVVSTDDEEIAEVARSWGAETPFVRPSELSDDFTGLRQVIQHGIEALATLGLTFEMTCCLTATAPFLLPEYLSRGLEALESGGALFAYSVARFPAPVQRALRLSLEGRVEMVWPDSRLARSQDLEPLYHDAGQFYWGRSEAFLDLSLWIPAPHSAGIVLPDERVVDIDTEADWKRAELMFNALREVFV